MSQKVSMGYIVCSPDWDDYTTELLHEGIPIVSLITVKDRPLMEKNILMDVRIMRLSKNKISSKYGICKREIASLSWGVYMRYNNRSDPERKKIRRITQLLKKYWVLNWCYP